MKIGFVVSFIDFRTDVRRVIMETSRHHEAVVYCRPGTALDRSIPLPGIEFRVIKERIGTKWNRFWEYVYFLFRAIPQSRENFFLMEWFKFSNTSDDRQIRKNRALTQWIRLLPKFIPYDYYLNRLRFSGKTIAHDIDQFVFFTDIADDYLLARLLSEKKPVSVYVYSWDHPYKHTRFSRRVKYGVWNEGLRNDVSLLQNKPANQIAVTGASQLSFIEEFRKRPQTHSRYPFRYLYFGCAVGIRQLVKDELYVITQISEVLRQIQPDWKLVVRPYPQLADYTMYLPLAFCKNIVMEEAHISVESMLSDEHSTFEKLSQIEHAEAFLHVGTTLGLEACFFQTPVFLLDIIPKSRDRLSLYHFVHQSQNEKYLIHDFPQNTVKSTLQLGHVLTNLPDASYMLLNAYIQTKFPVFSFTQFSRNIYQI